MGATLTYHFELRFQGRWEHYNCGEGIKVTQLFMLIAKSQGGEFISDKQCNRGLPVEASPITKAHLALPSYVDAPFVTSYLTAAEFLFVWENFVVSGTSPIENQYLMEDWFGDGFGVGWIELFDDSPWGNELKGQGLEDFRLIYWLGPN